MTTHPETVTVTVDGRPLTFRVVYIPPQSNPPADWPDAWVCTFPPDKET